MTLLRPRDVFDPILRDRIADLEARLAVAEAAADPAAPNVPFEWNLNRGEAVIAVCLARGPATGAVLAASLDIGLPGGWGRDGGVIAALGTLVAGVARSLGEWGWIVLPPGGRLVRLSDAVRIHAAQQRPFRAAVRFEASPATGPIQQRRIALGTRAYRDMQDKMQAGGGA